MGPHASQAIQNSTTTDFDFLKSIQSSELQNFNGRTTVITSNKPGTNLVNTTFKWALGGSTVLVTGTFTKWRFHIPLYREQGIWSRAIELEKGLHQYYKFIVDDEWRFNPEDPSKPDGEGNINNFIDTTTYIALSAQVESEQNMSGSLQESMIQQQKQMVPVQKFGAEAPRLPTHFDRCLFMDIKQQRQQRQEQQNEHTPMDVEGLTEVEEILQKLNKQQLGEVFQSCHSLEAPLHVVLNHVRMKDNNKFNVYSISHRFNSKFSTYKFFMYKKQ